LELSACIYACVRGDEGLRETRAETKELSLSLLITGAASLQRY
jgi:hypothetical protein